MNPGVSTSDAAPFRVLACAYASAPGTHAASFVEPQDGWNWVRQIALHHELTLVTRSSDVDRARRRARAEGLRMRVVGHELRHALERRERRSPGAARARWRQSVAATCARLARTERFDVAHDLTPTPAESAVDVGLPLVVGPITDPTEGEALGAADLILASARSAVESLDVPLLGRVRPALAYGVDGDSVVEVRPRGRTGPLSLFLVGRWIDAPYLERVVEALDRLDATCETELVVAGELRRGRAALRRLHRLVASVHATGSRSCVRLAGLLGRGEFMGRMRRADVVLLAPSPELHTEGRFAVEAMASGCAVIGHDDGASRALLAGGRGVLLSRAADATALTTALATAIERLAGDELSRIAVAEAGNAWVRQVATWDAMGRALTETYRDAVEPHRRARVRSGRVAA